MPRLSSPPVTVQAGWIDQARAWRRRSELAGDRRAGIHGRVQVQARQRRWLRARWHLIAVLVLVAAGIAAGMYIFLPPEIAHFAVGALSISVPWVIYTLMLQTGGIVTWQLGVMGEELTASELKKLRRQGWLLINHVMLEFGDVDHALIGPGGLFAVETKYRSDWSGAELASIAGTATQRAGQLAPRMRVRRGGVRPLVVMWGPALAEGFDRPFDHQSVTFCPGRQVKAYLESLPSVVPQAETRAAFDHLDAYVRTRDIGDSSMAARRPTISDMWYAVLAAASARSLAHGHYFCSPCGDQRVYGPSYSPARSC